MEQSNRIMSDNEIEIKIDNVKSAMQRNIVSAANNVDDIEQTAQLSHQLKSEANTFQHHSKIVKRNKCQELIKAKLMYYLLLVIVTALLILGILKLAGVFDKNGNSDGYTKNGNGNAN